MDPKKRGYDEWANRKKSQPDKYVGKGINWIFATADSWKS